MMTFPLKKPSLDHFNRLFAIRCCRLRDLALTFGLEIRDESSESFLSEVLSCEDLPWAIRIVQLRGKQQTDNGTTVVVI